MKKEVCADANTLRILQIGLIGFLAIAAVVLAFAAGTPKAHAAADIAILGATTTSATTVQVLLNTGSQDLTTVDATKWHIDRNGGGSSPLTPSSAATSTVSGTYTVTLTFAAGSFASTSASSTAALGLYVDASGVADTNADTNAVIAHDASVAIVDGQVPVITVTTPATSAQIDNVTTSSDITYSLSEAANSGTVTFTRTSGTADSGSPHTCTLAGTAKVEYYTRTLNLANTTNGCSSAVTLVSGTVYTIAFNATDAAGNAAATVTKTGVVFDNTGPVIVVTGNSPLQWVKNAPYIDPGATATDDYDTTVTITTTNPVDVTTAGNYTVSYDATDSTGNAATQVTRTVTVADLPTFGGSGSSGFGNSNGAAMIVLPSTPKSPNAPKVILTGAGSKFTKTFGYGAKGADVTTLQTLLAKYPDIYPSGMVTGYFGPLTKAAVVKFQLKNNVIKSASDEGAGRFGPKTKAAAEKLLSE